ncbi:MAG: OmpA family protein [Saprospirales bacterium]|nr:MAG: OmpA family protein [Saprospirales bacterium]
MVLFDTDYDETDSLPMDEIIRLRNALNLFPDGFVQLEARTDSRGGLEYNYDLATRRMEFAKSVFIDKGINESRFLEFIYGKTNPLADNKSAEGRQKNRSVLVTFERSVPLIPFIGRITDEETGKGLSGRIFIGNEFFQDSVDTNDEGEFVLKLPASGAFSFEFFSPDYIKGRTYYQYNEDAEALKDIKLEPLKIGMTFSFDDMLFYPNTTILMEEYKHTLPRLFDMLDIAKNYRFEIQGHVHSPRRSPQREGTYFYDLSARRARMVYQYLVDRGIEADRLEWKAYSNYHMVFPGAKTEMQMRRNRRVVIKVLEPL